MEVWPKSNWSLFGPTGERACLTASPPCSSCAGRLGFRAVRQSRRIQTKVAQLLAARALVSIGSDIAMGGEPPRGVTTGEMVVDDYLKRVVEIMRVGSVAGALQPRVLARVAGVGGREHHRILGPPFPPQMIDRPCLGHGGRNGRVVGQSVSDSWLVGGSI